MVLSPTAVSGPEADPREAAAGEFRELSAWAASVKTSNLPERVRRRAALVLCDDVAAIVAARDEPEVSQLQAQLLAQPAVAEATVFRGDRLRTDRYSAALANGAAADWCELDEGYRKATCHGGLCTLPALLAEAEAEALAVDEVLRCLAVAYEVVTRFARGFAFKGLTLHPHATFAAVGAAAAMAAARNCPAERFLDAVSAATTMVAPGPYNHAVSGALVRNVWAGVGAWVGMRCVDWAGFGIAGTPGSAYDVFVEGLGAEFIPGALTVGLGDEWAIEDGYHKLHACCQYAHSAIDALAELRGGAPDLEPGAAIERIVVDTHWRGLTLDNRAPATSLAAKFSMPHIVAAATLMGHAGAEAFAAATLDDPAIAAMRNRVELRAYEPEMPFPNDRPARVTWMLKSGERLTAECLSARGGPDKPFAPADIMAKLSDISAPVYPGLVPVAEKLIALDADMLARSWAEVVGDIAGTPDG
jgi:2-methylcitrate dehydratase PrpD